MSAACSIDYYFSPPQKRLMSPENSTRKVNTILKCQEINDIVLSSFGPVGEGDKCLALFTLFLPICDIFPLSLSFSLSPCPFRFSFSISLFYFFLFFLFIFSPPFVSSSFSSADHGSSRCQGLIPTTARKCCGYMRWHNTGDGLCRTLCAVVSGWIALIHLH